MSYNHVNLSGRFGPHIGRSRGRAYDGVHATRFLLHFRCCHAAVKPLKSLTHVPSRVGDPSIAQILYASPPCHPPQSCHALLLADLASPTLTSEMTREKDSVDGYKPSIDTDHGERGNTEKGHHNDFPAYHDGQSRRQSTKYDSRSDPFGDESDAEVQYRTMTWWQAAAIMIAETISLGILSLPSVLAAIGLVPGVILIVGLGIIATYTGYTMYQFKLVYPHVHNLADVGEIFFGAVGREIFSAAQVIFLTFTMGSHVLTFTIAMNTITGHATCTIVWSVVGMVILFLLTMPRTLKKVSYLSIVCEYLAVLALSGWLMSCAAFISILSAVMITMIGVGIEQPDPVVQATVKIGFASAFQSVTNIIFAFAGHVAFFTFISELKNPKDFPKALICLQIWDISLYVIVSIVVYRYTGPDVASPALGSASPVVSKVAYGIALPTVSTNRKNERNDLVLTVCRL